MDRAALIEACKEVKSGYVAAANFNCPGQIVISGEKAAVQEAMETTTIQLDKWDYRRLTSDREPAFPGLP